MTTAANGSRTLRIYRLDPELKARLISEAAEREMSLNDLVGGIVAERFGLRFIGTGRRSSGADETVGNINPPVSERLWLRFSHEADKLRLSKVAFADLILRDYFAERDGAAVDVANVA